MKNFISEQTNGKNKKEAVIGSANSAGF